MIELSPNSMSYAIALVSLWCALAIMARKYPAPQAITNTNGVTLTSISDINVLRDMLRRRFKYIKCRANLVNPIDETVMNHCEELVDKSTIENMVTLVGLVPGNRLGMIPLGRVHCEKQRVLLQFEQGWLGWYWMYIVFPNQNSGLMFNLTRVELLPRCEREKAGYKLGQSTIYHISVGASIGGKWYRGAFYVAPGMYRINGNRDFDFSTADGTVTLSHRPNGAGGDMRLTIKRDMTSTDSVGDTAFIDVDVNITTNKPTYDNGPDGCIPCLWGDGSMYVSYTDLHAAGTITVSSSGLPNVARTVIPVSDGVGWMDHQWGGGEFNSLLGKLIMNAVSGRGLLGGLSRYVWLNLHVNDQLQYMVYGFPKTIPAAGDVLSVTWNRYTPEKLEFSKTGKVTVLQTVEWQKIDYPVRYKVEIDNMVYILDGTPYGKCSIIDINNAEHWAGMANLLDENGKKIGTGFMEAQRFVSDDVLVAGMWKKAGAANDQPLAVTYLDAKNTISYAVSLIFLVIVLVLWIWLTIKLSGSIAEDLY